MSLNLYYMEINISTYCYITEDYAMYVKLFACFIPFLTVLWGEKMLELDFSAIAKCSKKLSCYRHKRLTHESCLLDQLT